MKRAIRSGMAFLILPSISAFSISSQHDMVSSSILTRKSLTGLSASSNSEDVQKLLEKAAKLREELAIMEGKTIEEVENEAREKKERQIKVEKEREEKLERERANKKTSVNNGRYIEVPATVDDMIYQASRAVERAFNDGVKRQTVRFALIKEDQYMTEINQWPGGAKQMYREAAKPLTNALLKQIYAPTKKQSEDSADGEGVPPRSQASPPSLKEQDIWDFDGSALHTAEASYGANGDVQALVLANTDTKYINDIETIDKAMGERLFLLINPFWRNVDSWSFNLLAPNGKKRAQEVIFDNGYDETYVLLRFSARGEECVALKAYPYDWQLYAYREEETYNRGGQMEYAVRLGSSKEEPTNAMFTELLNGREEFKETRNMRKMKKMF